ncbi:hypothetical protein I5M27_07510 [Adhaeribacter sp. BT258]|uniref:DUF3098 domain-containing protein n=1 Tax=Adhaeribacter terrigena TaxID=2793070 RepID=A0ABS1C097_9BACT|nr:hypothetical protein [Adhaeribacter terrigena]MBK0402829.1 hypothetical protein [Adhaeribacter terrigena]
MNLKRTFGAILTVLGIIGIIMGAYSFMSGGKNVAGLSMNTATALVPFIVGLIFFFSGISLIKHTGDRA